MRNMREFQRDFPGARGRAAGGELPLDPDRPRRRQRRHRRKHRAGSARRCGPARQGGEPVTVLAAADERDEAEWIVRELQRRSAAGDWRFARDGGAVPHQLAVARNGGGVPARRMPYRLVGAISFYERREVKDLLAYLRLMANPSDDEAFLRAIAVPRRGLGDTSLAHARPRRRPRGASRCSRRPRDRRSRSPICGPTCARRFARSPRCIDALGRPRHASLRRPTCSSRWSRAIDYEACCSPKGPRAPTAGKTFAS